MSKTLKNWIWSHRWEGLCPNFRTNFTTRMRTTQRRKVSVTRYWNKKLPKYFKSYPKSSHCWFYIKSDIFKIAAQSHQILELLLYENVWPKSPNLVTLTEECFHVSRFSDIKWSPSFIWHRRFKWTPIHWSDRWKAKVKQIDHDHQNFFKQKKR